MEGGASGCYRPSGFISTFQRVVARSRMGEEHDRAGGVETVKRYWIYRVFHEDSLKIARDFITGEMSVNKNE